MDHSFGFVFVELQQLIYCVLFVAIHKMNDLQSQRKYINNNIIYFDLHQVAFGWKHD